MIDRADRAPEDERPRPVAPAVAGASPPDTSAELHHLLGAQGGLVGPIVYTGVHADARFAAGGLATATGADEFDRIADGLAEQAAARPARVLLVTDDREGPAARAVAAIEIARQLGRRELRVLLIDADFRAVGVGAQLGQDDHLGLVDIARYGASPRSCIQGTGIPDVGLLGVGSFRPDEEEPFSDEELRHALAQARGLSDIVLMVGPTRLRDGSFNPLLAYVDGAVLAVTLHHPSADLLEPTLGYLARLEISIRGLAAFAQPHERGAPATAPPATPSPAPSRWDTVDVPSRAREDDLDAARAPARMPFQHASPEAEPRAATPGEPEATPGLDVDAGAPAADDATERSSSPVFRVLTLALLMLVLGFGGWWVLVQRAERSAEPPQPSAATPLPSGVQGDASNAVRPTDASRAGSAPAGGQSPLETARGAGGLPADEHGAALQPPQGFPAAAEPLPEPASRTADAEEAFPEEEIPGGTPPRAAPVSASAPAASPPTRPTPPDGATTTAPAGTAAGASATAALRRQLESPVGTGYGLHVWSFPDSMEAVGAGAALAREGMAPAVRGAMVDGKRWYRVIVGNFARRSDALTARALLAGHKGIDYVGVVRVQP